MQLHSHLLMNFYCPQYAQLIRLLEKLLAMQCGPAEEEFVQRFRRHVPMQSQKQLSVPLQHDEQGVAFSSSEGNSVRAGQINSERELATICASSRSLVSIF